jgi:hypothetical protein
VRGEERGGSISGGSHVCKLLKKCYNLQTKKIKLNSDYTVKFVLINTSKQDVTWIYLDKVISGPYSG